MKFEAIFERTEIDERITDGNESPNLRRNEFLLLDVAKIHVRIGTFERTDDIGQADRFVMINAKNETIPIDHVQIVDQLLEKSQRTIQLKHLCFLSGRKG